MLSLEQAAAAVFPAPSSCWACPNESDRLAALSRAAIALGAMEAHGLSCGVFGSALRPGDFFHNSDVDLVAWLPNQEAIGGDLALNARIECHRSMGGLPFDLVLLPCSNETFGQRIRLGWSRQRAEVERASRGAPLLVPLDFGPADIAFIDADRLAIAERAARRMAMAARAADSVAGDRAALSLCSSMQTVVRVAEKCSKDMLRHFARIRPERHDPRPLYPILAYPCDALGGLALASAASLDLYFECRSLLDPPLPAFLRAPALVRSWASRMALVSTLFSSSMRADFAPALSLMAATPLPRGGP